MTPEEYKFAKAKSGVSSLDDWCGITGISKDRDKSFSSGRTPIKTDVASKITTLITNFEDSARELQTLLQAEMPECSVQLDDESLALDIIFASGQIVRLQNAGIDTMNYWRVYKTESASHGAALFVQGTTYPVRTTQPQKLTWYLWRGDFVENRQRERLQSYANPIKQALLNEVFKRYM